MTKIIVNKGYQNQKDYEVTDCTVGSVKQIEWADKIKADKIGDIFIILSQPGASAKEEQVIMYCNKLNTFCDAKFWIDNKDNSWKEIVKSL